ncbi:MAG: Zn-dependent alcohol dehydrogenase [Burkholderiaceae bacterium]|nr:MAG: Zn-dependent alcohol dehydrogenase [Burkholderiaceae bacterium]
MGRAAKAIVYREGGPIAMEPIDVAPPKRDEITLKLAACGVCHSDLSATNGTVRMPPPLVLGHEGFGSVVEVGEGVAGFKVGDAVLTSFARMCGKCAACVSGHPARCEHAAEAFSTLPDGTVRTHDAKGEPLNVFCGLGAMAEYATIHVDNAIKVDAHGIPPASAAIVSCAVMTGVGSVTNTAKVEPGSRVAVFGLGGVGLNAVQGAVLAGAATIVAVDTNADKLAAAKRFGATDVVNAKEEDMVKAVRRLGRVDYGFECVGSGELVSQAYKCLAPGGTLVIVGVAPGKDQATFTPISMAMEERCIRGSTYGSARPQKDIPALLALYRGGRLKLDEMVTRTYSIDQGPQAFDDLKAGRNLRGVIVF